MSNVGYDLDTSGGLMPLIRALIKPPDEEPNSVKQKKPQHPYYKRPGKGHNHDSCDACGEGGDLICCDKCPASFHLGCYDPPLDENDIPAGQWLCRECHAAQGDKPPSSRSSRAVSPADSKSDTEKKTRSLRNNRTSTTQKKKSKDKDSNEHSEDDKSEKKDDKELNPMEVLVKAAKIMNPKQFELPREMRIPCPFPGTDKDPGKNGNGGVVSVDAWGCVPLPGKLCYVCQATCKAAPLLQCDYCPLLFHQDCLDPPLTALPTGRWMCPNHVEQYIDWKMVNSISATERVALWDKFSEPVDQHAIKIDFIRRARNPKPPFRVKVPMGIKGRVVVPGMVRAHYRRPPPLLPSRREHVRCARVLQQLKATGVYSESEEDTDKKHIICMNLECPKYTKENGICPHEETTTKLEGISSEDAQKDLQAIKEGGDESSGESDWDELLMYPVKRRKLSRRAEERNPRRKVEGRDRLLLRDDGSDVEELLATAELQLQKLDERLVKLLAWQQLQQVLVGMRSVGPWSRAPLSARAEQLLQASVDRTRLHKLGLRTLALPSQLLSREDQERIARRVWGAPPPPAPRTPAPRDQLSDATVRATLLPLEGGGSVPMRLSRLSLGTDSCDVELRARCRRLAPKHATIFYDEVSGHFELINYSPWGTLVDGVLYTCALPDAPPDAGNREERSLTAPERGGAGEERCRCGGGASGEAWEGAAVLSHGALLQLGCVRFVFCITDSETLPLD